LEEPTIEVYHGRTLQNRVATYLAATRPAFLTASVLPVLAAGALAQATTAGGVSAALVTLTVVNIILIHAAANVLNDYFDALNGTDGINTGRIYPFSGGSRFIQNNVLTVAEMGTFGFSLLAAGAVLGLYMVSLAGPLLLALGVVGTFIALIYSAPPCLACRGLGDIAVGTAFGVLPVAGTCLILTGSVPAGALWLGVVIGCFVAAILWVNSIPDIEADRSAGKLTIPVRLGAEGAARATPLWFVAGFALLAVSPLAHAGWVTLIGAVPAVLAGRAVVQNRLDAAMPLTIITHAAVCVLLAVAPLL